MDNVLHVCNNGSGAMMTMNAVTLTVAAVMVMAKMGTMTMVAMALVTVAMMARMTVVTVVANSCL